MSSEQRGEFGVYWPPRSLDPARKESIEPLLRGELIVFPDREDPSNAFRIRMTLRRGDGEADRVRWNEQLAFPEYSWMAKVRVWDHEQRWLWPNLPFLLRAYGEERVDRYGGVDPGKGIDNDFAAVLIRPLRKTSASAETQAPVMSSPPLVSAEWYSADESGVDKFSVVHVARADEFCVRLRSGNQLYRSGRLGVWLIYADFLGSRTPRDWPPEGEYDGGILAYHEIDWQPSPDKDIPFRFKVKQLVPPTGTGFDWEGWTIDLPRLEKNLEMTHPKWETDAG